MILNITVLAGDGIGPEVTRQAVKVLKAVGETFNHTFRFHDALVGAAAIDITGKPLPDNTLDLCLKNDAVLFGTIGDLKYDNDPEAKVRPEQGLLKLRKSLGLYANIRPVKSYPTLLEKSPLKRNIIEGVDFVIYRELTGGIYFGEKKLSDDGSHASDLCEYSENEIERIAHLAFKAARVRRKKVTLIDKANVLETSRLWRKTVTNVAKSYSDIELDCLYMDNAAMQMITNPKQFDIILTENMFGDIISDEGSVIAGSISLLASASVGDENALFEPIHGPHPLNKDKDIANPIASILAAALLLEHYKLRDEAKAVRKAVERALELNIVTPDIDEKSKHGTKKVGNFIADYIASSDDINYNQENIDFGQSTII